MLLAHPSCCKEMPCNPSDQQRHISPNSILPYRLSLIPFSSTISSSSKGPKSWRISRSAPGLVAASMQAQPVLQARKGSTLAALLAQEAPAEKAEDLLIVFAALQASLPRIYTVVSLYVHLVEFATALCGLLLTYF